LRPDIAAKVANAIGFATPNAKAIPLIDARLTADRAIYPPPGAVATLYAIPPIDNSWMQMRMTRAWTRMKTGRAAGL